MADAEVQVLQSEIAALKDRMEKFDDDKKRIWERIDKQAKDMIRIQVVMENIEKTMSEVKVGLTAIEKAVNTSGKESNNKWTSFFEKWFWLALGAAVTYFSNKH